MDGYRGSKKERDLIKVIYNIRAIRGPEPGSPDPPTHVPSSAPPWVHHKEVFIPTPRLFPYLQETSRDAPPVRPKNQALYPKAFVALYGTT